MLAGKQFGRRHKCGLRTSLDRRRHGEERHDRLAAADIALEQAQHPILASEVRIDLGKRARLRSRQLEGEGSQDSFPQVPRALKPSPRASLHAGADHGKRKLIGEKLVISEPRTRRRTRRQVGLALGRVQTRERVRERGPALRSEEAPVDPFRERRH